MTSTQFDDACWGVLMQLRAKVNADNVNETDLYGWSVLHHACEHGQVECVKYCVELGANVNLCANHGLTPLMCAKKCGATGKGLLEIVRILLDAGATVDCMGVHQMTSLFIAIHTSEYHVAALLIDRGARLANVLLNKTVPRIPDWINTIVTFRCRCRRTAFVLIAIHKYQRTMVTGNNDIHVLKLIGKHIWSHRMDWWRNNA
jgi:ankyrin repeat protein